MARTFAPLATKIGPVVAGASALAPSANGASAGFTTTHFALPRWRLGPVGLFAAGLLLAVAPSPARALVITPDFDSSITGNVNAATIENTINTAIGTIDGLYSNPITVPVEFTYDPGAAGNLLSTNQFYNSINYSTYVTDLTADSLAHPANTVLPIALANLSSGNDANGTKQLALSTALFAMLTGTAAPTILSGEAPVININSLQSFAFTQPASTLLYDLTGGLEHELDEVLGGGGAGSTLNSVGGSCITSPGGFFCNKVGPLDLYRYSAPGTPSFDATSMNNPEAYFSVDGGTTNIVYFNQNQNGDLADFAGDPADGATNQCGLVDGAGSGQLIQNAFNCTGPDEAYTDASPEFTMEESIGWDPSAAGVPVPEPGSLALFGTALLGLAGFGAVRRRTRIL